MSGHILFAVFRLPFGCKIPPHHTPNIINAKKITLTDGRKRASRAPVHVRALYPFAVRPCARSRLSVRRCRSRSPTTPTPPPQNNPPKTPPHAHTPTPEKQAEKTHPKRGRKPPKNTGDTNPRKHTAEKSRANFDTRVTHAHARSSVHAHAHAQLTRQSRA